MFAVNFHNAISLVIIVYELIEFRLPAINRVSRGGITNYGGIYFAFSKQNNRTTFSYHNLFRYNLFKYINYANTLVIVSPFSKPGQHYYANTAGNTESPHLNYLLEGNIAFISQYLITL